jgi:hypothetical protein
MQPIPTVNGFKYYVPIAPPPAEAAIVPLVKQFDGSYLPATGNWQLIKDMSIVDADVLDTNKWRRKFWAFYGDKADHLNDELQRYVDSGVDYQNGKMLLTATPRAGTSGHAPSPTGIQYPLFDSGMVRSVATSQFFFSDFQVVMPKEKGIWPAYWIIPGNGTIDPNPEMDMMEFVYNGSNETANMIHCNASSPPPQSDRTKSTRPTRSRTPIAPASMRPLVDSCVGSGKSLTMAELARRAWLRGERSIICAHTRELVEQNAKRLPRARAAGRHQRRGARRTHLARSGHQRGMIQSVYNSRKLRPGGEHLHRRVPPDSAFRIGHVSRISGAAFPARVAGLFRNGVPPARRFAGRGRRRSVRAVVTPIRLSTGSATATLCPRSRRRPTTRSTRPSSKSGRANTRAIRKTPKCSR